MGFGAWGLLPLPVVVVVVGGGVGGGACTYASAINEIRAIIPIPRKLQNKRRSMFRERQSRISRG